MNLNLRPLLSSDYEDHLVKWWSDWGWSAPSKDFLPEDGIGGLMVVDGETPVCAGFIYTTNSKAAWVDWIISNKDYRKKPERSEAINMLISSLTDLAKDTGHRFCYALIKHKGLIQTYEGLGYLKGDSYNHEMIKIFN